MKPAERIATFDNDGTLWIEQPIYNQFAFAIDEVKATLNQHPEWKTQEPFTSILTGDLKGLAASGEKGMVEIVEATHSGMTTDGFRQGRSRAGSPSPSIHASRCSTPTSSISR